MRSKSAKTAPSAQAKTPPPVARLPELDFLRGLVMVLMVLDHAWYFFSSASTYPLAESELPTVSVPMFFTSWFPIFCAPVFVVLAGLGTYFQLEKGGSRSAVQQFLITRGLWLIVLDVTVVHWLQHFSWGVMITLVLWGIGWAMLGLAALLWLPPRWVGIVGVGLLVSQNMLDSRDMGILASSDSWFRSGWIFLRRPGWLQGTPQQFLLTTSLLPYLGFISVGFAAGKIYQLKTETRRLWLLWIGLSCLLSFAVLRLSGFYGDPHPWQPSQNFQLRCLSFLNVSNLPPSLQFALLSLGGMSLVLVALESNSRLLEKAWLTTLGRVPMFFYLLQWLLLHLLAIGLAASLGKPLGWLFAGHDTRIYRPFGWTPESGFSLPVVYAMWLLTVALAYPLCAWFAAVKRTYRWWWLRYL